MRGAKILRRKKMSINEVIELKKPEYVYIPLICGNDTDITVIPKIGDYVYKGSVIGNNKGNFKMFIHSSVSGKVTSIENKTHPTGKKVKCIVIENDFKEKLELIKPVKEEINDYTKEEFIDLIKNAGIVGMGGAGFPTYVKYDTDIKIKTLIVNAAECEAYISADYILAKTKIREILEGIDAIMEINDIDKCIIGIQKSNKKLIKLINNYIGTYLNISIKELPNVYPIGYERALVFVTTGIQYDKLPIEKNIVVNNISTIYAIYKTLKTELPVLDRIITVSGHVEKPTNVLVKIGTPIKAILEEIPLKEDNLIIVTDGPMMGHNPDDDCMVTKEMNALLALRPLKREETSCIRCGKCIQHCPVRICPVLIKDAVHNVEKMKSLAPERCISCGICSYICPARIDLRNIVDTAKVSIREENQDGTE